MKKFIASVSSVLAALLASSCCWLPFVLLGLGISGSAIVVKMSQFRPLFLVVAGLALGYSIFLYVRKSKKASCCDSGKKRFDWHLLSLISTALIVIVIAIYPLYAPLILKSGEVSAEEGTHREQNYITEKIEALEEKTTTKKSCCP